MTFTVKIAAALVATAALGVSVASAFVGAPPAARTAQSPVAQAGSDRIGRTAPDPSGGLTWAVRLYVSTSGASCVEAGRVSNGRFGQLRPDGIFREIPVQEGGTCGNLTEEPVLLAVNSYPAAEARAARTVLFGQARSDVAALSVTGPDGVQRVPDIGRAGEFVLPLAGTIAPRELPVRITLLTGQELTFDWR